MWIMIAFGWASNPAGRCQAWPRWSEPLSTMPNTRWRVVVFGSAHDLADEVHERLDPGARPGGGEHFPGEHVEPGQQGERAVAGTYSCSTGTGLPAGCRGGSAGSGLAGAGIDGLASKDSSRSPCRNGLPTESLVHLEDDERLGFEVGGRGGRSEDRYRQRLIGYSARHPTSIEDGRDRAGAGRGTTSSAARSGPVQRDSGTPVAAGSWQASATIDSRSAALNPRRARPDRADDSARPGAGRLTGPATGGKYRRGFPGPRRCGRYPGRGLRLSTICATQPILQGGLGPADAHLQSCARQRSA